MRRLFYLMVIAIFPSCAPDTALPAPRHNLAIQLRRDIAAPRATLVVTITNNMEKSICIRSDALQNPYSYEMNLKLRYPNGSMIKYNDPGYIEPPVDGTIRVEPGSSVHGRYYLYPRFKLPGQGHPFPRGLSARASFPYQDCNDSTSLRAASEWQRI